MLEESLITILEEEGPNVILQHDSLRLLNTGSFQAIFAQAAWSLGNLVPLTLPPLQF
jgi:hypothetical protein